MNRGRSEKRMSSLEQGRADFNLARLKKNGEIFEIVINPDEAVAYKEGKDIPIKEIVRSEHIFSHAQRGDLVPENHMASVFETADTLKIAKIILDNGEIQLTESIRKKHIEQKYNRIIATISMEAYDPKTGLPHPPERIKLAMEEAKIRINPMKTTESQIDEIIIKLKPILPISVEKKMLMIVIPTEYAPKCQHFIRTNSTIKNENYGDDGSWEVEVQISGGMSTKIKDELNALTKGRVKIKEI